MTREEIIRMARGAGFDESDTVCAVVVRHSNGSWVRIEERLALFADLVAAAERDACAQIVERNAAACRPHSELHDVLSANALAIRARATEA